MDSLEPVLNAFLKVLSDGAVSVGMKLALVILGPLIAWVLVRKLRIFAARAETDQREVDDLRRVADGNKKDNAEAQSDLDESQRVKNGQRHN